MKILKGVADLSNPIRKAFVTIGNFDGVHKGHGTIINALVSRAHAAGGESVIFTFRPHPQAALNPDRKLELITTYDEKLEILSNFNVDYIVEEPFGRKFSTYTAEQFFSEVLIGALNTVHLSVGYDFGFGRGRSGNIQVLSKLCKDYGVELNVTQPQSIDGLVCSSTAVRQHLREGNVRVAREILGRAFFYRGVVSKGDGRGHKLGFPTANVIVPDKIIIKSGVYAVHAKIAGESVFGLTNVGLRPTFAVDGSITIETHLLDFNRDIYGESLEIFFVDRLRDEIRFNSIDELKRQITKDIAAARFIFNSKKL